MFSKINRRASPAAHVFGGEAIVTAAFPLSTHLAHVFEENFTHGLPSRSKSFEKRLETRCVKKSKCEFRVNKWRHHDKQAIAVSLDL